MAKLHCFVGDGPKEKCMGCGIDFMNFATARNGDRWCSTVENFNAQHAADHDTVLCTPVAPTACIDPHWRIRYMNVAIRVCLESGVSASRAEVERVIAHVDSALAVEQYDDLVCEDA